MVEGYFFIISSFVIGLVPEKNKNFNEICLLGVTFYFFTMMLGGPIELIKVSKSAEVNLFIISLAFSGIGQSLVMTSAFPAMEESTRGIWSEE